MADEGFKRKLAAILSADVEGYSQLMDDDEEATVRTLKTYRAAINDLVQQYRGRIVDSPGDNILAEYSSVVDAVNCAVEIQRDLAERNTELAYNRQMRFRIGVNLGDVIEDDGNIYGDGVNIAARVESLAEAGSICISGRAYDQVSNKLGLEYENLGEHQVKNISTPIRVYRVLSHPGAAAHRVVQAKETLGRKWRKIGFSAAAAIVLVAVALSVWQFYIRRPTEEPASEEKMAYPLPDKPSIAVLPFDNLSGDPEQEYLADGISDNIITALSYIPEMFVIARNSSFTYKGKAVKIQQVSEDLGVRYILEGSVLKSGDKIRVTAQLIDALTGGHIWSERFDRDLKELFALLDEITQAITVELQVKLSHGEQARMWYESTSNFEAWGYTVKGLSIFYNYTKEAMAKSRVLFEQALELDPEYAHALTMLAFTHFIDVRLGFADSSEASLKRSIELARKAVKLDEDDPLVHSLWQHIYLIQRQYDKAIQEGRKAIALGPSDEEAHILFGEVLYQSGLFEESVQICEKAMRLHPHTPTYYYGHMMGAYYGAGRYEESLTVAKQLIEQSRKVKWDLGLRWGLQGSALALMELGREGEARELIAQLVSGWPYINLDLLRKRSVWVFYKDPANLQQVLDSLRKAGMPEHAPLPLPDKPSIAVLAFDNLSGDPEQEYFSDGIAENIITALSKVGELFVIARNSSFTYKDKPVKVQQISRELGVRYVLEGSVQKSGGRVRITAQLIDAKNGQHLWAENYDRDFKDIFEIQDEITMKIVTALRVELTEGEQARILAKLTKNPDVYLKIAQAQSLWRKGTKEGLLKFGQAGQEIVDIEPESQVGYRLLGWYNWGLATRGVSPRESYGKSFKLAQKALSLDESDAWSHGLLGSVYLIMRQYEKAIAAGERSIELDPNGAMVHGLLGLTLSFAGRPDEAIGYLNKGIRLNPFPAYWYYSHLGRCYLLKGQYEKSLTEYKKALHRAPDAFYNHASLAVIYALLDRQEEAGATVKKALEIDPSYSLARAKRLPYKNEADLKLIVDAMRKAGFPE